MSIYTTQIQTLRDFPDALESLIDGLTPEELTTAYNAPEWTIAQNVHHVADSHMNSFIRLKLILTEENPPLKAYRQADWANLPDANHADVGVSLLLLRGLHARLVQVYESLTDEQWGRIGTHTESGTMTPAKLVEIYSNHCQAHLKQIQEVLDKMPS